MTQTFLLQALNSAGDEWSAHKTRIFQLSESKPLAKVVPSRFPYICVEWTLPLSQPGRERWGGLAHVVEAPEHFTNRFCLDIISGALDIDPFVLRRMAAGKGGRGSREDEEKETARVRDFKREWDTFDWTQYVGLGDP
jgi:hypothetical protein